MPYQIPIDTHAAGDTGHISDHNGIADVLTALANAGLDLYIEPTGTTARTCPRYTASVATTVLVSGTLYVTAIGMHQNTVVNNITFATKSTAAVTIANGWYVLLDSSLIVRAVTANQAGSGTWLAATNTPYTLATNSYTTTYSGLYYAGIMVAATTQPNLASPAGPSGIASALNSAAPILAATSSTGQTTPPTTGTTMGALTAANGFIAYAATS